MVEYLDCAVQAALLTIDDHLLGERNLVLQGGDLAGVVPIHLRCWRVKVEGAMTAVWVRTDLVVQIDFATHVTEALKYTEALIDIPW